MPRTNEELEALLGEWADLLEITGTSPFRVRAYQKAARAIGGHAADLADLDDKAIRAIPSVGENMAARIREYIETGGLRELEELRELVPAGLRELMRVPGLGPKKAALVHREAGVTTLEDLIEAIEGERLRGIKGLGARTEENLLRGIRNLQAHGERSQIDVALSVAEEIVDGMRGLPGVEDIAIAGSLRRMRETIGDVDVLVASEDAGPIMDAFCALDTAASVLAHGPTKSSIVTRAGVHVDLRVLPAESWGAGLVYFTGSKAHNIKLREIAIKAGLKLSEWGLFPTGGGDAIAARTEEEVYEALGLPWIPPPMREDTGEIEAAREGSLPDPVTERDIRGDLHGHTTLTDGIATLEDMVAAAAARGYAYYAVTDHAENLHMTGMTREAVLAQRKRIAALQKRHPRMRILHGTELNIGRDGSVDYDPEFLAGFDLTVASIHSLFRLPRDEQTARLIRAMENPMVTIIGHPTGRMIGRREPVDVDFSAVCDAAVRTGTALEINCFPDRMDLRDANVRWAVERGVTLTVSTDSHSVPNLGNLRYGIGTAQRGWLTKRQTLNARTLRQLTSFIERKRRGA